MVVLVYSEYGVCLLFSEPSLFLRINVPSSPHTSSLMFGHRPATVRLAGRIQKRHARFESSEAPAEQPAPTRIYAPTRLTAYNS